MASSPPAHGMMPSHDDSSVVEAEVGRSRFCGVRDFLDIVDAYITTSRLGYFFHLSGSGHVKSIPLDPFCPNLINSPA
jgi:hypothetical protein